MGLKLPKIKAPKISVPSISDIGRSVNQVAIDIGKGATQTWKDAGKGEVGKLVSGSAQSVYNVALAAPRAVATGNYEKEIQRATGSALNIVSGGTKDYFGGNKNVQKFLNSKTANTLSLGLSGDYAGIAQGTRTLSRDGYVSNDNRDDFFRGAAKVGAGVAAYTYMTTPTPAANQGGAVEVASGVKLGPPGTVTSTPLTINSVGAAESGVSGASFFAKAGAFGKTAVEYGGYAAIAQKVLTGQMPASAGLSEFYGGDVITPDSGNLIDSIFSGARNLFGGGSSDPTTPEAPMWTGSATPAGVSIGIWSIAILGGVGYFLLKRSK